jgi:hypothetical protein
LLFVGVFALVLVGGAVSAADTELKFTQMWTGSVDDEALQKKQPATGVITTAKAFEELWKAWKVGDKMPKIDFDKEIVVVATTNGSKLNLGVKLDDKGDLKVLAIATRDLRPGFRYQIGTVAKEGVKTVGGKELPKD